MESRVKGKSLVRHLICGPRHTREEAFLDNLEKMRLAGLKFGRCLCDTATNAVVIRLNNPVFHKVFKLERISGHYNSKLNRDGLRTQQVKDRKSHGPNCQKDIIEKQPNRLSVSA